MSPDKETTRVIFGIFAASIAIILYGLYMPSTKMRAEKTQSYAEDSVDSVSESYKYRAWSTNPAINILLSH